MEKIWEPKQEESTWNKLVDDCMNYALSTDLSSGKSYVLIGENGKLFFFINKALTQIGGKLCFEKYENKNFNERYFVLSFHDNTSSLKLRLRKDSLDMKEDDILGELLQSMLCFSFTGFPNMKDIGSETTYTSEIRKDYK